MHVFAKPLCARPHRHACLKSFITLYASLAVCCAAQRLQAETWTATDMYTLEAPVAERAFLVHSAAGGQVVGSANANQFAVAWNGSSGIKLNELSGACALATDGIHQAGYTTRFGRHATVWSGTPGSGVDLHPSALSSSTATGVYGAQQVGYGSGTPTNNYNHALVWNGTAQSAVDLHPAGWTSSMANATDGNRQAGSGIPTDNGQSHALLWDGSADSFVDLHPAGVLSSTVLSISGQQQVGSGYRPDGVNHALLWNGTAASAVDLNPAGFDSSVAAGTNGGQQVGYGTHNLTGRTHALYWESSVGSFVDLHTLLPPGFISSVAYSVDQSGIIYGVASAEDNSVHAIMWTPEPGSLLLLAAGGVCLLRRSKTHRH